MKNSPTRVGGGAQWEVGEGGFGVSLAEKAKKGRWGRNGKNPPGVREGSRSRNSIRGKRKIDAWKKRRKKKKNFFVVPDVEKRREIRLFQKPFVCLPRKSLRKAKKRERFPGSALEEYYFQERKEKTKKRSSLVSGKERKRGGGQKIEIGGRLFVKAEGGGGGESKEEKSH